MPERHARRLNCAMVDPAQLADRLRVLVSRGLLEPVSGGRFPMRALLVLPARSLLGEKGYPA